MEINGDDAEAFLESIVVADLSNLKIGSGYYILTFTYNAGSKLLS